MKVYRYLIEDELQAILLGNCQQIGHRYSKNRHNTHKYNKEDRYLHFFLNKDNCKHAKSIHLDNTFKQYYIATYNIPLKVIAKSLGAGYYYKSSNYDDEIYMRKLEVAIPTSIFKPEWLISYEKTSPIVETSLEI